MLSEAQETVEETLKSANATDAEREKAFETVNQIAARVEKANKLKLCLKPKDLMMRLL